MEMWSFIFKIALVICSVSTDYVIIARTGIKEIAASVKLVVNLKDIKISSMSGDILTSILHFTYTNVAMKEQKLMTNIIWILLLNFLCSWSSEVTIKYSLPAHASAVWHCAEPSPRQQTEQNSPVKTAMGQGWFVWFFFWVCLLIFFISQFNITSVSKLFNFTVTDLNS